MCILADSSVVECRSALVPGFYLIKDPDFDLGICMYSKYKAETNVDLQKCYKNKWLFYWYFMLVKYWFWTDWPRFRWCKKSPDLKSHAWAPLTSKAARGMFLLLLLLVASSLGTTNPNQPTKTYISRIMYSSVPFHTCTMYMHCAFVLYFCLQYLGLANCLHIITVHLIFNFTSKLQWSVSLKPLHW